MSKNIFFSTFIVAIAIVLSLFMKWDRIGVEEEIYFSEDMTLKELGKKNDVQVKELLHILSHEDAAAWDLPKDMPIADINVDPAKIKDALEHIKGEEKPVLEILKYSLWAVWISFALLFILAHKKIKKFRVPVLVFAALTFGLLLGATPNPMESVIKLFKLLNKMEGEPKVLIVSFVLFSLFSVLGSKLICAWGCQLGTLQESLFNIQIYKKKYKFQIPFAISLPIRIIIFILFLFLLFGIVVGIKNFVLYHHINFFKIYNLDFALFALYSLPILILASVFIFRPFCQFICPFGLYSWLLENIAINRIKIIQERCIECKSCVKNCPTQAMKGIYEKKREHFLPDCWSCGVCIEVCPQNAIKYGYNNELPEKKSLIK